MNASLAKETRTLAPMFGITVAGTVLLSLLMDGRDTAGFVVGIFTGCCAVMGAITFGSEFGAKTMPLLLAQPIPRRQLWAQKMAVLGAALAASYIVLVLSLAFILRGEAREVSWLDTLGGALGVALIAFCATPGITLLVKNTLSAVAGTICLPFLCLAVVMFLMWLPGKLARNPGLVFNATMDKHPYFWIVAAATVYCAVSYWLGRRGFLRLQAVEVAQMELGLPAKWDVKFGPILSRFLPRYSGPLTSLFRKELLVQRNSFMIAGIMCVAGTIMWLIWKADPWDWTELAAILSVVIPAVIIPAIAGAVTFAEERTWGTSTWQLTLPVSPFKQWLVKMVVCYAVTILLSLVLPLLLVEAAYFLDHYAWLGWDNETFGQFCAPALFYAALFPMLLYGSSLSNNPVRGMIFGIGLFIATAMFISALVFASSRFVATHGWDTLGWRIDWLLGHNLDLRAAVLKFAFYFALIAMAAPSLMLTWFTYTNFRAPDENAKRWRRQALHYFFMVTVPFAAVTLFLAMAIQVGWTRGAPVPLPQSPPFGVGTPGGR